MRVVAVFAMIWVLSACTESAPVAGGWKKGKLDDGRVTFAMPGIPRTEVSTNGQGNDAVREEKATCEFDSRHFDVRVLSGPFMKKDISQTPADQRTRWAKSFLMDWMHAEKKREVKEEGEWSQGQLRGYRAQIALPPQPPGTPGGRTVPVYIWLHVAAWNDRAIMAQFVATQAAAESSIYRGAMVKARERFLNSLEVN